MYLGPKIFCVYQALSSALGVETNGRVSGAYILEWWLLKIEVRELLLAKYLVDTVQSQFSAHNPYFLVYLRRAVYMEYSLAKVVLDATLCDSHCTVIVKNKLIISLRWKPSWKSSCRKHINGS